MSTWCPRNLLVVVLVAGLATYADRPSAIALGDNSPVYDEDLTGIEDVSGVVRINSIDTDFRIYHNTGEESVGYQDDSTTLELFHPVWSDDYLWFLDGRYSITNQARSYGNFGVGVRHLNVIGNRFWGLNGWFDVDGRSEDNTFKQIGFGIESLGKVIDFRANGYIPIQDKRSISRTFISNVFFQQNTLGFTRASEAEVAMDGFDAEVGWRIPFIDDIEVRTYAGFYYYDAEDTERIHGFRGRIEGYLFRDLGLNLILQNDSTFDTTVLMSAVWSIPVSRTRRDCECPQDLMYERMLRSVQRTYQIYVTDQLLTENVTLTDATTNQPFHIIHVDSNAPAGGDGTIEDPYQFLSQAQLNSQPGNTIFAHADSVFDGDSITLKPNQKLLGEGMDAFVDTVELGTLLLPRATNGVNLPLIQNTVGSSIVLAANDIVAGFQVLDPTQNGILGDGINGNVDVSAVSVTNPGLNGISLQNIIGDVSLQSVAITGAAGSGIFLDDVQGSVNIDDASVTGSANGLVLSKLAGNADVTGSTITGNQLTGVSIIDANGMTQVTGSTLQQTGGVLISIDNSQGTIDFSGNTINSSAGTGVMVTNSSAAVSVEAATINNTPSLLNAVDLEDNTGTVSFTDLKIATNGGVGLFGNNAGTVIIDGMSTIAATGSPAIMVDNAAFDVTLNSFLTSTNSSTDGVSLTGVTGSFTVNGTTISGADNFGISVTDSNSFAANFGDTNISDVGVFNTNLGAGVNLVNNTNSSFTFNSLNIDTQFGDGIFADNGGQIVASSGTNNIDATGAGSLDLTDTTANVNFVNVSSTDSGFNGLNLDNVSGTVNVTGTATALNSMDAGINIENSTGSFTFSSVDVQTTGGDGIAVANSTGPVTFNGGQVLGSTGDALSVSGGSSNVTYRGDLDNTSGHLIAVSNTTGGTVEVSGGVLNDNGAQGILLQNVDGTVSIRNANVQNSTGTGVDIQGGTGSMTLNSLTVANAAGTAFNVNGGAPTVAVNTAFIDNSSGRLLSVTNTTGGAVNFNGGFLSDFLGQGILVQNVAGNVNVGTIQTDIQNSTTTGIDVQSSTGNIGFFNAFISSPADVAFNVDGGSANVTFDGQIFNFSDRIISIANTVGGAITMTDNGAFGAGMQDVGGTGLIITNSASTINISDVQLQNSTGNAVDIMGGSGNYTLSNLEIDDPAGIGVNVDSTAATVVFNSPDITNSGNRIISVTNLTGGGVVFVGGTILDTAGQGILVDNNQGFVSIDRAMIMDPTGDAVTVTNSNQVLLSNLMIDTTNSQQRGLVATGNTFLQSFGGSVITQDAAAVIVDGNGTFTQMQMNFSEVTAINMGGPAFTNGILLNDVFGDFTTADGMIVGATGDGIQINYASQFDFGTISINGMTIDASGMLGIRATGLKNFVMTNTEITNSGGVLLQTENTVGGTSTVNIDDSNSITAIAGDALNWTLNGAGETLATITGNNFSGADDAIQITAADSTTLTIEIDGNTLTGMNAGAGINLHSQDTATINATVTNNDMTVDGTNGFQAFTDNAGATMLLLLGNPSNPMNLGNDVGADPNAEYILSNTIGAVFNIGGNTTMGAMSVPQHIANNGNTSNGMTPPNVSVVGNIGVVNFQTIPSP